MQLRRPAGTRCGASPRAVALLVTALVLAALVGGAVRAPAAPGTDHRADHHLLGSVAPATRGPTLAGGALDLAALRGRVVVVNFWAAWCVPCREELPALVAAERRWGDAGLRLVGIDVRDGERQAREMLAAVGGDPAASLVDPHGELAARWKVAGLPATFVLDAHGRIRAAHLGEVSEDWIGEAVVPLLAEVAHR